MGPIEYSFLSKYYPFLGDKSIDEILEITCIKLHHNGAIHIFFKHVKNIDKKIKNYRVLEFLRYELSKFVAKFSGCKYCL